MEFPNEEPGVRICSRGDRDHSFAPALRAQAPPDARGRRSGDAARAGAGGRGAPAPPAGPMPRLPDGHPDMQGFWNPPAITDIEPAPARGGGAAVEAAEQPAGVGARRRSGGGGARLRPGSAWRWRQSHHRSARRQDPLQARSAGQTAGHCRTTTWRTSRSCTATNPAFRTANPTSSESRLSRPRTISSSFPSSCTPYASSPRTTARTSTRKSSCFRAIPSATGKATRWWWIPPIRTPRRGSILPVISRPRRCTLPRSSFPQDANTIVYEATITDPDDLHAAVDGALEHRPQPADHDVRRPSLRADGIRLHRRQRGSAALHRGQRRQSSQEALTAEPEGWDFLLPDQMNYVPVVLRANELVNIFRGSEIGDSLHCPRLGRIPGSSTVISVSRWPRSGRRVAFYNMEFLRMRMRVLIQP